VTDCFHLSCLYTCYVGYLTPDCIPELTYTLLYAVHITVYLLYSCHFLFQYILSSYAHSYIHVHLPFYSYAFIRSSDSLNLHIQICDYLLLIRYLKRNTGILRNLKFSLFIYWFSYLTFTSVDSLFSIYIYHFQLLFHSFIHLLSCVDIYIYCCSVTILS